MTAEQFIYFMLGVLTFALALNVILSEHDKHWLKIELIVFLVIIGLLFVSYIFSVPQRIGAGIMWLIERIDEVKQMFAV